MKVENPHSQFNDEVDIPLVSTSYPPCAIVIGLILGHLFTSPVPLGSARSWHIRLDS